MKRTAFIALVCLTIACTKENIHSIDCDTNKGKSDLPVFTSKVSGQQFSANTVRTDRVIVKFSDEFVQQIEACQADVSILSASVKSELNPISLVESSSLERVFPDAGRYEERSRERGLHRWYYLDFSEDIGIVEAESILSACSNVELVEMQLLPRRIGTVQKAYPVVTPMSAAGPFDDPLLSRQWGFCNDGSMSGSREGCDINVFPVWGNYPQGQNEVIVAVIDGLVDFSHPDLEANLWTDEDGSHGKNFVQGGTNAVDDHGTHVAGTVAAVNNNGIGVCGVAGGDFANSIPGAKIMSCAIFDETPVGRASGDEAGAIKWAADHGAVIAQNSWGYEPDINGDGEISDTELANYKARTIPASLKEAIDYFVDFAGCDESGEQLPESPMKGGLVLFATGNANIDYDVISTYDRVVAVASLAQDFSKAYYSNYGSWVDISAPGGDARKGKTIYSTVAGGGYGYMQGTSMACPHVSGAAALLLTHYQKQGFTSTHLRQILCGSVKNIKKYNSSHEGDLGKGLIDVAKAISFSEEVPEQVEGFSADLHSNMVTLSWDIPEDELVYSYAVFISKSSLADLNPGNPSDDVEIYEIMGSEGEPGSRMSLYKDDLDFNTDYHIRIAACNYLGMFSELSAELLLTVGSNNPPVIEALTDTNVSVAAHETLDIRFRVYDPDGHQLSCTLQPSEKGVSLRMEDDIAIVTVNAPDLSQDKTYNFILCASDSYVQTNQSFSITVLKNHSPYLIQDVPNLVFNGMENDLTLALSDYFNDEDGETLTYEVSKSGTTVIKYSIQDGLLKLTPFSYGTSSYTIKAKDACGDYCSYTFKVLVRDVIRPVDLYPNPVVDVLNVRLPEEGTVEVLISNRAGSKVYENLEAVSGPFNPFRIDLSNMPAGEYYVRTKGCGTDGTYSIIKK